MSSEGQNEMIVCPLRCSLRTRGTQNRPVSCRGW